MFRLGNFGVRRLDGALDFLPLPPGCSERCFGLPATEKATAAREDVALLTTAFLVSVYQRKSAVKFLSELEANDTVCSGMDPFHVLMCFYCCSA